VTDPTLPIWLNLLLALGYLGIAGLLVWGAIKTSGWK
jgi:hypothetical protein